MAVEVVLLFVTLALVTLFYYHKKFNYWSSRGIPGPVPSIFLGNLKTFFQDPWVVIYDRWAKMYGPVFGIYEQSKPVLVVTDAKLVKEILIKQFDHFMYRRSHGGHKFLKLFLVNRRGDDWRRVRTIISPTFTASKMKAMFPLMNQCYNQLDDQLEKVSKANEVIAIKDFYDKLTSTVIARCAFATQINPFDHPNEPVFTHLRNFFKLGLHPLMLFIFPEWFLDLIQFSFPNHKSFMYIAQMCQSILEQRKRTKSTQSYPDLLQLMMDAKVESVPTKESVPDHESHHSVEDTLQIKGDFITEATASLADDEITANAILFFAAGYETTATTLNFSTYCLARYPEIQGKLHQEVKAAFGDTEVTYETLTGTTYLDAFVSEVLRFLPPATVLEREASSDAVLSTGLKIEKGTYIRFPVYTIHHNHEYFPEPEEFKVERFLPENRNKIIPGSYLPFAIGPRNCVGMRFALMEIKLTLAKLVLKYKFVMTEDVLQAEKKFAIAGPLLRLKNDLRVKVELRSSE